jgi:hypothetical protein
MQKQKFRFSTGVLVPMALAALAASSTVAQAVPPVAVNDAFIVTQTDVNISLNVLANDADPDGTALTVNAVSPGSQGGVTVDNNGNIIYTPAFTFSGTETFTYTAIDGNGEVSNVATVTITVLPPPSTFNSAIAGNGSLNGARSVRKRSNTTFTAYNSNNLSGDVVFRDPVSRTTFRSTQITAVQVFGNTGRIFGFGTFNGFDEVGFVLTTVDQFPSYITRGDTFSLQIGTDFTFNSFFNPGGSRVVGGFGDVVPAGRAR